MACTTFITTRGGGKQRNCRSKPFLARPAPLMLLFLSRSSPSYSATLSCSSVRGAERGQVCVGMGRLGLPARSASPRVQPPRPRVPAELPAFPDRGVGAGGPGPRARDRTAVGSAPRFTLALAREGAASQRLTPGVGAGCRCGGGVCKSRGIWRSTRQL